MRPRGPVFRVFVWKGLNWPAKMESALSAQIIDGKKIAADIRSEIKIETEAFVQANGFAPGLAVVLVGENPASQVYVKMKGKACAEVGFYSEEIRLPESTTEEDLLGKVAELNGRGDIHGILVQLPLPSQIRTETVLEKVDPDKDVDCFHPRNVGKLLIGETVFAPCTPAGVQELLKRSGIPTRGKRVVILGRSNIVGKPMAALLLAKGEFADATVTVCHSKSENLSEITASADILIAAIGRAQFVKKEMVKSGAVVIDVGINRIQNPEDPSKGKLVGDVDTEPVKEIASAITPVPGGVGPMTIATLLTNTLTAAKRSAAK